MRFYCVTKYRQKNREPTTSESDELSVLLHLFVSVRISCCEYFLITVKLNPRGFFIFLDNIMQRVGNRIIDIPVPAE